jgi:hypothetical protein
LIVITALLCAIATRYFWDWLHKDGDSNSSTLRNAGLLSAAVTALLLAVWRSRVAERQADTAQRGLLNERYQKGAEMLGSDMLSVRLGGIYALQRLADEHPEQYHIQIMRLFCAFVRRPTADKSDGDRETAKPGSAKEPDAEGKQRIREDVQAVMEAIGSRSEKGMALEKKETFTIDLRGASLRGANLESANFSGTLFGGVDLSDAVFGANFGQAANLSMAVFGPDANLSGAWLGSTDLRGASLAGTKMPKAKLMGANLSNARLMGADLSKTSLAAAKFFRAALEEANLSGATLYIRYTFPDGSDGSPSPALGLTQAQLDEARADPNNPPRLDGVFDAETGEPLVWHGKPPDVDRFTTIR